MQPNKQENAEISERLEQVIDYFAVSRNKFSKLLGYNRGQTVYDVLNGKSAPSFDFLKRLTEYSERINIPWLLTGDGKMILEEKTNSSIVEEKEEIYATTSKNGIPLIPTEAMAGLGAGAITIMEHDIQARYIVPDFTNVDFMIRVNGSSMYPKYNSGDVVACRLIKESSFLQWGKVHVIHTQEQGSLVKRLFKTEDPTIIECKSDNEKYPPFEVKRSEITNIALVVGAIRLE